MGDKMNDWRQSNREYWATVPAEDRLNALLHEMRTPLQDIRSGAQVLQSVESDNFEILPEDYSALVNIIVRSMEHINVALEDIAGYHI